MQQMQLKMTSQTDHSTFNPVKNGNNIQRQGSKQALAPDQKQTEGMSCQCSCIIPENKTAPKYKHVKAM